MIVEVSLMLLSAALTYMIIRVHQRLCILQELRELQRMVRDNPHTRAETFLDYRVKQLASWRKVVWGDDRGIWVKIIKEMK